MNRSHRVTPGLLALAITCAGAAPLPAQRQQTLSQSAAIRRVYAPVTELVSRSVVEVQIADATCCLGTVVGKDLVLTKYSEAQTSARKAAEGSSGKAIWNCRRGDRQWICELLAFDQPTDLALLRVPGADLQPIEWATQAPNAGAFLATPATGALPLGIGILSTAPYVHSRPRAFLGVRFANPDGGPAELELTVEHGAARAAGLLAKDIVIGIDEDAVTSAQELRERLARHRPGDRVRIKVRRDAEDLTFEVTLGTDNSAPTSNQEGIWGPLSAVRSGFAEVLQHDTVLRPEDCGGPIVDLSGKAVGLNIARAGRVETLALPAAAVQAALERLAPKAASLPK